MNRLLICITLLPIVLAAAPPPVLAPAPGSAARVLPVAPDAYAGSSINVVAGVQNTLFTAGGNQYTAYYAADGALMLGRRILSDDQWTTVRTPYAADVNDAHRNVAIAVDGEGYLHVAWDHHVNPLNYARSVAPGSLELGARQPMTGRLETSVTYPQFLRLPDGDLLFFYRDGRSGRGNLVLNRYSVQTHAWSQVQSNLIDGEGERSAYTAATVDRLGVLHLAWNWRDSADVASNHDLCYARSTDGGVTWTDSANQPLPVPFTAANAEYALRIPAGRSLMNPPAVSADHRGRPLIANYWWPEGSHIPQYHVVRFDGKAWSVSQVTQRITPFVLSGTATRRPPISRSVLLPYKPWRRPQELHLVYRDDEHAGRIMLASCRNVEAATPVWCLSELTAGSVGAWEPSLDPEQALRLNQLHLLVQHVEQLDGNDGQATSAPPTPIATLLWSPFLAGMREEEANQSTPAAPVTPTPDAPLVPGEIRSILHQVADWQLAQPFPAGRDPRGWEVAAFYLGVIALGETAGEERYLEAMRATFERLKWEPGPRPDHADDHCIIQAYLRLDLRAPSPEKLGPSRQCLDAILTSPSTARLEWGTGKSTERWTWADALFMGPASWLMMSEATGDRRYADFAHREWWATTAALHRSEDGWFARDESFLDLREPNGRRLYWSRGNGWVAAGLVNVLKLLREDDPERPRYLALYHEMMTAALAAQQADGLWRPGLLDPAAHPARETSGSAFLTYALAYGLNAKLLDPAVTEPAVRRAWQAIAACVTAGGKLEHVQPIGAAPEGFDPRHNDWFGAGALLLAGTEVYRLTARSVPTNVMQRVYDEVKTPFKYGVVLEPPPGKKVDCPNVFRHAGRWYMLYVQLEPEPQQGYTTQLAVSDDLLKWQPLGTVLERGPAGAWDLANAGGGVALFDPQWGGSNALQTHAGRYWQSYIGGSLYGYEKTPLAIGLASTADPTQPGLWQKLSAPVLRPDDTGARAFEAETLYKSYIFRDDTRALGAPFVMFYNAKPAGGSERIFTAVSDDLQTWRRLGTGAIIENLPPAAVKRGGISGDPQVVRMGDLWVMFYFGAFWKPGAFDTFACSYDLVNWTKWTGEDLIKASEPFDTPYAHKPWLIKHEGVVYHFYCAVGGKDQHRTIALATSKDLRQP